MRSTLIRGLFVFTISLTGLSAIALAQDPNRCRFSPAECRELRADRREIRADRREIRGDVREIRQDRRESLSGPREFLGDPPAAPSTQLVKTGSDSSLAPARSQTDRSAK